MITAIRRNSRDPAIAAPIIAIVVCSLEPDMVEFGVGSRSVTCIHYQFSLKNALAGQIELRGWYKPRPHEGVTEVLYCTEHFTVTAHYA